MARRQFVGRQFVGRQFVPSLFSAVITVIVGGTFGGTFRRLGLGRIFRTKDTLARIFDRNPLTRLFRS